MNIKTITLKVLPKKFKFLAVNVYPFLLINRKLENGLGETLTNHEKIHSHQQLEIGIISILFLLLIGCGWWSLLGFYSFYIIYVVESGIRFLRKEDYYRDISFEREAYGNQYDSNYLKNRKLFSWIKYIKHG